MSSRFKAPLIHDQLVAIQERNKDNADIFALLWEIKRLRAVVLQADQLQRSIRGRPGYGPAAATGDTEKRAVRS
jgi:hypothetical protein